TIELPGVFPATPLAFALTKVPVFSNERDVLHWVQTNAGQRLCLDRTRETSDLCRKAKHFLDRTYHLPILVQRMATSLGVGRESITRRFSKELGIAPVAYRNILRVSKSLELISCSESSVTDAAF